MLLLLLMMMMMSLFPHQLLDIGDMEYFERHRCPPRQAPSSSSSSTEYLTSPFLTDVFIAPPPSPRLIECSMGVLANPSGTGKTASVIGLIDKNAMPWDLTQCYFKTRRFCRLQSLLTYEHAGSLSDKLDITVIVCPPSLITQWADEFTRVAPRLTVRVIKTVKEVKDIVDIVFGAAPPSRDDVIIIIPTLFKKLVDASTGFAWKRVVFDEAPVSVNFSTLERVVTGFTWFLSGGSPEWHVGLGLADVAITRTPLELERFRAQLPPVTYITHPCYDPLFAAVHDLIQDEEEGGGRDVKAMLAHGNIAGVVAALGGVETSPANVYELLRRTKVNKLEAYRSAMHINGTDDHTVFKCETLSRQLEILAERFAAVRTSACSICFDVIRKPVMEPKCNNVFCAECLFKWLRVKKSCPMCRVPVALNSILFLKNDDDDDGDDDDGDDDGDGDDCDDDGDDDDDIIEEEEEGVPRRVLLTKMERIVDIIARTPPHSGGGRFLICSGYNGTFECLRKYLTDNDLSFGDLKGKTTDQRRNALAKYKDGRVPILLLNASTEHDGLNLPETTDVIIYHKFQRDRRAQTIGRAQRLGRSSALRVHDLESV
jgi:SNF2 family DNA or RNA helicase